MDSWDPESSDEDTELEVDMGRFLSWYRTYKASVNPKLQKYKKKKSKSVKGLSEYEKIRLENIADRQAMFEKLKLGDLASELSNKKTAKKCQEELWQKLCVFTNKEADFSEAEVHEFFEFLCKKTHPKGMDNILRSIAKAYYVKTDYKDFFKDYPKIFQVLADIKQFDWLSVGTKRTEAKAAGKSAEPLHKFSDPAELRKIWNKLCEFTKKTDDFEDFTEDEIIEFLESMQEKFSNLSENIQFQKIRNHKDAIASVYFMETDLEFDEKFPNVEKFVVDSCPYVEIVEKNEKNISAWSKFCTYTNNGEFTEKQILGFLKMICKDYGHNAVNKKFREVAYHISKTSNIDIWEEFPNLPRTDLDIKIFHKSPSLFWQLKLIPKIPHGYKGINLTKNQRKNFGGKKKIRIEDCWLTLKDVTETNPKAYKKALQRKKAGLGPRKWGCPLIDLGDSDSHENISVKKKSVGRPSNGKATPSKGRGRTSKYVEVSSSEDDSNY